MDFPILVLKILSVTYMLVNSSLTWFKVKLEGMNINSSQIVFIDYLCLLVNTWISYIPEITLTWRLVCKHYTHTLKNAPEDALTDKTQNDRYDFLFNYLQTSNNISIKLQIQIQVCKSRVWQFRYNMCVFCVIFSICRYRIFHHHHLKLYFLTNVL